MWSSPMQMQDRGVQVGDVIGGFDGLEAQFVRRADRLPPFDSGPGKPHGEPVRIMVASWLVDTFARRRAAEFASPDEQGLVPQSGGLQIVHQRRDRAVGLAGVGGVVGDAVGVAVPSVLKMPAAGIELDEPDPTLQQPSGQQAFPAEIPRPVVVQPVAFASRGRSPCRGRRRPPRWSACDRPARTTRSERRVRNHPAGWRDALR